MFNIFAGDAKEQMKRKFNLSTYISPKIQNQIRKNQALMGMDPQDTISLNKAIAEIEATVNKSISEYDRISLQLKDKSKVINDYIRENGDIVKGEVLVLFHKTDVDLLNAQLAVIDRKVKAGLDKAKAIRDERKLYFDKLPKQSTETQQVQVAQIQPNQAAANPLALVGYESSINQPTTGRIQQDYIPSQPIVSPQVSTPVETPQVADTKNNNASISVEQPTPTITAKAGVPLSYDGAGNVAYTTSDLQNKAKGVINERLAHLDEDPQFSTGIGANYAQTLAKVRQDKANVEYELFVNPHDGTYYLKGFTIDNNGQKTEYDQTVPLGLDVLGKLKFNPYKPIATPEFYKNQLKVNVIDSSDEMPEFYQKEWKHPSAKNFKIDSEADISLLSSFKEKQ